MSILINPIANLIVDVISQTMGIQKIELDLDKIKNETKTNIPMDDLKEQIRIVQDLAIAKRIETADEVEIEEYYESEKEGNLGLKGNQEGISLGASGSGSRVVRRVYKFKGYNDKRIDAYEQTRDNVLKINTEEISE